jgi:anti-sigma B factor antagonist
LGEFKLEVTDFEGIPVIRISGELDLYTAARVRIAADLLLGRGHRHLIFDLDGTSFIDSSGIAALIAVKKRPETRDIGVVAGEGPARRLVTRLALQRFLCLHPTARDAREHLRSQLEA